MKVLRYILIVPVSVVIWLLTLVVGILCLEFTVLHFCGQPSGMACFESGWTLIDTLFLSAFSGLSAILIIFTSALLAPEKKLMVCLIMYCLGLVTAFAMAIFAGNVWEAFLSAAIFGGISVTVVYKKLANKKLG